MRGDEAVDSKNSRAALPQPDMLIGSNTRSSENETSCRSETAQKKHKKDVVGEFLPDEKKSSSIEYGT